MLLINILFLRLAIYVCAKCRHLTIDPCPSSDPDLASIALSTGRLSPSSSRLKKEKRLNTNYDIQLKIFSIF